MALRPDQARDRDSIQRDVVSANIVGPVKVSLHSFNQPILDICEPDTSANKGTAKFRFRFRTIEDIEVLARDILARVHLLYEAREGHSQ